MSNGNESAYPNELASPTNDGYLSTAGLTKRELFAAMAMQGLLARNDMTSEARAIYAIEHADDLIATLEKFK